MVKERVHHENTYCKEFRLRSNISGNKRVVGRKEYGEYRKHHIGRQLYNEFFNVVKQYGRNIVRCVTSPVNKVSISFHTKMGFEIESGNKEVDGISVFADYDGPNQDRVLFVKKLS